MTREEEIVLASQRRPIYTKVLESLELAFRKIEQEFPVPEGVFQSGVHQFRYRDGRAEHAIFLKFARLLSLLNALDMLTVSGFVQEQCIIQRAIDETNENIFLLAVSVTNNTGAELQNEFLVEFWKEDYANPHDPVGTRIRRGLKPRSKIRAFLNRVFDQPNPSRADDVGRSISEMYSGFVHGAAPHIFELFDEQKRKFCFKGIAHSIRHVDYIFDAQNSYYRALQSGIMVSKALGFGEVLIDVQTALTEFQDSIGIDKLELAD